MAIPTTIITSTSPIPMPSFNKQQTNFVDPGVGCLQLDQALLHSVPSQALAQDQDPQHLFHPIQSGGSM